MVFPADTAFPDGCLGNTKSPFLFGNGLSCSRRDMLNQAVDPAEPGSSNSPQDCCIEWFESLGKTKNPMTQSHEVLWHPRRDMLNQAVDPAEPGSSNSPQDCCIEWFESLGNAKNPMTYKVMRFFGTPGETRTHYLTLRRRTLYPGELRRHEYALHEPYCTLFYRWCQEN